MNEYMHYFESYVLPLMKRIGLNQSDFTIYKLDQDEAVVGDVYRYPMMNRSNKMILNFHVKKTSSGIQADLKPVVFRYPKESNIKEIDELELVQRYVKPVMDRGDLKLNRTAIVNSLLENLKDYYGGDILKEYLFAYDSIGNIVYLDDVKDNVKYNLYGTNKPSTGLTTIEWVFSKKLRSYIQTGRQIEIGILSTLFPDSKIMSPNDFLIKFPINEEVFKGVK